MQAKWIFLIAFSFAWTVFTWWTVRRIWRKVKAREDESPVLIVVLVVLGTIFVAFRTPVVMPMPPFEYWQLVGFWAFYFFPLFFWIVYVSTSVVRAFASWYYPKD